MVLKRVTGILDAAFGVSKTKDYLMSKGSQYENRDGLDKAVCIARDVARDSGKAISTYLIGTKDAVTPASELERMVDGMLIGDACKAPYVSVAMVKETRSLLDEIEGIEADDEVRDRMRRLAASYALPSLDRLEKHLERKELLRFPHEAGSCLDAIRKYKGDANGPG